MWDEKEFTRRSFLGASSAALVAAAAIGVANGQDPQEKKVPRSPDHHLPNEEEPGPNNTSLDKENQN